MHLGERLDGLSSEYVLPRVVDEQEVDAWLGATPALEQYPGNLQEGGDPRPTSNETNVLPSPVQDRRRSVHHTLTLELGRDRGTHVHVAEVFTYTSALVVGIGLYDKVEVSLLIGMTHGAVGLGKGLVFLYRRLVVDLYAGGERWIDSEEGTSLWESISKQKRIMGQPRLFQKFVELFHLWRWNHRCRSLRSHCYQAVSVHPGNVVATAAW
mmetsp:Transcript_11902/g.28206  ORF Transcript_11902/g.28206 Transcript_11902/m.28206 type:complete len:211 (-) Transcript_11902:414-1046(-)